MPVGISIAEMKGETLVEVDIAFKQVHKSTIFCCFEFRLVRHGDRCRRRGYVGSLVEELTAIYSERLDPEAVRNPQPRRRNHRRGQIAYRIRPLCVSNYTDRVRFDSLVRRIRPGEIVEKGVVGW